MEVFNLSQRRRELTPTDRSAVGWTMKRSARPGGHGWCVLKHAARRLGVVGVVKTDPDPARSRPSEEPRLRQEPLDRFTYHPRFTP